MNRQDIPSPSQIKHTLHAMKLNQVYSRYWIWIPVVLLLSLVYRQEINLYVYTDHYQFTLLPMALGLSIFFFISGFGYYLNRKKNMLENMTNTHRKFTRIGFSICTLSAIYLIIKNGHRTSSADISSFSSFSMDQFLALSFIVGVFIVFVGFIVYVVNTAITTFYID